MKRCILSFPVTLTREIKEPRSKFLVEGGGQESIKVQGEGAFENRQGLFHHSIFGCY